MFTLPTLAELNTAILADIEAEYSATINPEGKAMLRAFAAVQAAKLKQLYLAIAQIQKNIFVDTCDDETLIRFGLVKLGRQPFQGVAGQYTVTITGTAGTVVPVGTIFKSDDDSENPGILYRLDTEHTMAASSASVTLRSLTPTEESELEIGDTMTITAPVAGLDDAATVTAEFVQPLAAETMEAYRDAVLNAFRLEAQGGAATDYRIWAADAQGVAKVYPYAKANAPCEINLYVEATEDDSSDGKGTPTQSILDDVEDVVNFSPDTSLDQDERGRRPLQVIVNYLPVTPKTVAITVTGYQNLDADIQADLLAAFEELIDDIRPFVAAADSLADKNDILDTNKIIGTIITAKPGSVFTSVAFTIDGVSYSTYTFVDGNIPWLNTTITYN